MRSVARRVGSLVAVIACAMAARAAVAPAKVPASAQEVADDLLSQAVLPPGATPTTRVVSNLLDGSFERPGMNPLTDVSRLYLVPGQPGTVLAYVRSHLPPAGGLNGASTLSEPGGSASGEVVSLPASGRHLYLAQLLYLAVADGFSASELRVDAQVVWLPSRPKSELVPAGGVVEPGGPTPSSPTGPPLSALRAHQLRAVLNALPLGPTVLCVGGLPTSPIAQALYSLVFRARASAAPSFQVVAYDSCGTMVVYVWVHGHPATPLSDRHCRLLNAVQGDPPGFANPQCLPPSTIRPTGSTS